MIRELAPDLWRFDPPTSPSRRIGIVAGLHGDELGPVEIIRELSSPNHPLWTTCPHQVTLVLGNPKAIALGLRSVPGGADFNRSFGDSSPQLEREADRIDAIKEHLRDVEILLDLHQTQLPIAPCAVCPPDKAHLELAKTIGAHQAVTGAEEAFSGGMLIDWAKQQGALALTLETGSIGDPDSGDVSLAAIRALLTDSSAPSSPSLKVWRLVEPLRAPADDYRWTQNWHNGSLVSAGTVVANSSEGKLCTTVDGAIFLPKLAASAGEVCALQAVLVDD